MVIQNSEVTMASKSKYSSTTKAVYQMTSEPAIRIGDITIKKPDEADISGSDNPVSTGLSVGKDGGFLASLNYALGQNGEVQQVDEEGKVESPVANYQTRMQTMHYLIRVLLLGKIFGENTSFNDLLQQLFGDSMGTVTTTTVSYERTESQELSYIAKGTAVTADGRRLEFDYGFEMSESFHEEYESVEQVFTQFIDPLVINLTDSPTTVSNQTFYFDLDGDGKKDEINRLDKGSGYLALDKNEDGEINDGTELFGASTGDGFRELAIFDEDCNGWIDENDPIFDKLRVWSMNESGEMELYTLRQSDAGAIYLGRVKGDYIHHDDEHKAKAAIRESGIFLHESDGRAGSIQHVDFAT
ncbi:MAG: hypothetical protein K5883_02365 [Pseudobutyrivibrio sp.]|nr:hypothetical protein [Pseudobutyrivibrio sp.]